MQVFKLIPLLALLSRHASAAAIFAVPGAVSSESSSYALGRRAGAPVTLTVDTSNKTANGYQIDAMLEANINDATDGGIWSELLQNHAFQESSGSLAHWSGVGGAQLSFSSANGLTSAIPGQAVIAPGGAGIGLSNPGWPGGIAVQAGKSYTASFYARSQTPQSVQFAASLVSGSGATLGSASFGSIKLVPTWKQYTATITPTGSAASGGKFQLTLPSGASSAVSIAFVSLTPTGETLRADISQAYADLKPAHVRIPGGNAIEGNSQASRYRWNETIGPLIDRPGRPGTWTGWDTESFGLHEFLDWLESIGSAPVLAQFAGYSLDHTVDADMAAVAASNVDELHYITDTNGQWAALRKKNGRDAPWDFVKKVEIGNEDGLGTGPQTYQSRWNTLTGAIKAAFGDRFELLSTWTGITGWKTVDVHDYNTPSYFIGQYDRYDSYARDGRKYEGLEFAVINSGLCSGDDIYNNACRLQYPTLDAALAEAVFMAGMERNGDIVTGSAYAPGLGSVVSHQWTPNLIGFNPSGVLRTVSYYAQQGFSLFPTSQNLLAVSASTPPKSSNVYHSIGQSADGKYVVRLVNYNSAAQDVTVQLSGAALSASGSTKWTLNPDGKTDLQAANTFDSPDAVPYKQTALAADEVSGDKLTLSLPAYSFTVVSV